MYGLFLIREYGDYIDSFWYQIIINVSHKWYLRNIFLNFVDKY